jgi:hypothetical protein
LVDRGSDPTSPRIVVTKISWSDLPHSLLEAKKCFNDLVNLSLVEKRGSKFIATESGQAVMSYANLNRLWTKSPPAHIINTRRKR